MSQSCFSHVIFLSLPYHFLPISYEILSQISCTGSMSSRCYGIMLYYSLVVCCCRLREGSAASVHPPVAGSAVRQQRASLLSQLTRYGDIEEPEQIDDIAYVTPDMLDGMSILILSTRTSVVLCYLVVAVK